MFNHEVLVASNMANIGLLCRMGLKNGIDFQSVKGSVAKGYSHHLCLMFKDRNKAMMFKLRATV